MDKDLFFYELEGRGYTFQNKKWDETKHGFEDDMLNMAWEMWSSAKHSIKAQAVPEGYVLVPKEPTLLMQRAGSAEAIKPNLGIASMRDIYKAMIEAREPANDLN